MKLCSPFNKISVKILFLCSLASGLLIVQQPAAQAVASYVPTGTLTCVIDEPDIALHFGSSRPMTCTLRQKRHPRRQRYTGTLKKYGIEWGVIGRTKMRWQVFSRKGRIRRGGLQGSYGGVTLEGAVSSGVGGNIVSGGPDGVLLSPLGGQTQTDSVNVTTGVMRFDLRLVR